MKILSNSPCLSVLFLCGLMTLPQSSFAAPPTMSGGTTTMVIQKDTATLLEYNIYSTLDIGTSSIPFPIGSGGATFELWIKGSPPDTNVYFADSKVVNAYSPTGVFTIETEDPWIVGSPSSGFNYIKRTRADKGYSCTVLVSGLKTTEAGAPLSSKEIRLDRKGLNYFLSDHVNVITGDPERGPYSALNWADKLPKDATSYNIEKYTISKNGKYTYVFPCNMLTAADSTKACGEEQLILTRYADLNPDGSVLMAATPVKKATMQVWPVSSVEIMGLVPGQTVTENLVSNLVVTDVIPQVAVRYKEMYPDSKTYCQVYAGPASLGKAGTKLPGSVKPVGKYYHDEPFTEKGEVPTPAYSDPATIPQNFETPLINLNPYCATNGLWTMEVITETPFNSRAPERLLYITFTVDKGATIRGQITTGR